MSGEGVRLFVAVELPEEARDALLAWRRPAVAGLPLRPLAPEALHVTLAFLGWRRAAEAEPIGAAVRACAASARDLALGAARWLPPRGPRVLAVELADGRAELAALQRSVSDALEAGGWYEPERRPFLAHVTVARARRGARVHPVPLDAPPRVRFDAPALTLFRSHLSPRGARYEPVERVELGGGHDRL